MEGAAMDAVRVDVLDRVGLAGLRVDGKDGEGIFAAGEDPRPSISVVRGAVGDIDEAAVRMDMHGADRLSPADIIRLGDRVSFRNIGAASSVPSSKANMSSRFCALQRHIDPGLGRVEIEVARPEAVAAIGRDRHLVRSARRPYEVEDLQRARLLRLRRPPRHGRAVTRMTLLVVGADART